jgi:hypothetical protein
MSAFPPPTNGFFNGATYNALYFADSNDTTGVTKEYLEENYLPRVGNPIDAALSTTFEGEIIEDSNIILAGTQGTQYIQYPNTSKQYTAMNTLPANQTYNYATVTTDANGAINAIASNTVPTTTIPVKVASAYGTYSSSYTSFTLNTNGGTSGAWAQNQFFTVRYNISIDYNASSTSPNQYQNNGTATGTMNIYPFRFGSNWCSNSNAPSLGQLPNSINGNSSYNMVNTGTTPNGGVIAPSGRQFWSYQAATIGGTNMFYVHGSSGSLVFQLVNPSGWSSGAEFTYSIVVELLYTGASRAAITSSGFNQNF